jgi:hypothetical protein
MVGKNASIFPMIGKIFHAFSNDWKKFSREENRKDFSHKGHKGHKAGGKKSGRNAGGGKLQEHHAPRFAEIERRAGSGCTAGARAARPHFCRRKLIFIPTFHSTFSLANYA